MTEIKKLTVEQYKNESPDIFVLRAFAKALPSMSNEELAALLGYVMSRGNAEMQKRMQLDAVSMQRPSMPAVTDLEEAAKRMAQQRH